MIEVAGPASRWVARAGRPADVVWGNHDGIPSYESDTGKILVYALLVANEVAGAHPQNGMASVGRTTMLFPHDYGMVATRTVCAGDHELAALHDDPDAAWVWRPLIYEIGTGLTRRGSQEELLWRWSLHEMDAHRQDVDDQLSSFVLQQMFALRRRYGCFPPMRREPGQGKRLRKNARKRAFREYAAEIERLQQVPARLPFQEADERADAILREHLNPQQLLDLDASGQFYARGTINRLYVIRPGNGAAIVNPRTRHELVSLCLHPEKWMPHADVALAITLAIESGPDGEEEMLAGARPRMNGQGRDSTRFDRAAWDRERALLPAPYA